jgi:hypothetical protein
MRVSFWHIMGVELAIEKLKTSNQGLKIIQENVHEQLGEIASDPRLEGLVIDLENLFESYLDTWVKSNSEILDILKKGN